VCARVSMSRVVLFELSAQALGLNLGLHLAREFVVILMVPKFLGSCLELRWVKESVVPTWAAL
jgi:hypothetical protein